jgi:hypothetical protein
MLHLLRKSYEIINNTLFYKSNDNEGNNYTYYLSGVVILVLYLISMKYSYLYHKALVPRGDPFSYCVNFFAFLDTLQLDYWGGIASLFKGGNWYLLINTFLALLSPILVKEPYSIMLVNFILFGCASISVLRIANYLKYSVSTSFFLASLIFIFPSNYGFKYSVSLSQMQLDTAFLAAMIIAIANTLIYCFEPNSKKNAFIAGVSIGLGVWSRGNSLLYLAICLAFPLVVAIRNIIINYHLQNRKSFLSAFCFFLLPLVLMVGIFFGAYWKSILDYYSVHKGVISNQSTIDFRVLWLMLKSYPGRFWNYGTVYPIFTLMMHAIVIFSLFASFTLRKGSGSGNVKKELNIISITGAVIFYGILLFNLIFLSKSQFNVMHIHVLLNAGLVFCCFSLFSVIITTLKNKLDYKKCLRPSIIAIMVLFYGGTLTAIQTPKEPLPFAATPHEVEAFAINLHKFLENRSMAILWYETYNLAIINYYRIKNDLPSIQFYTNQYWRDLWLPPYREDNKENIMKGIKEALNNADFVLIPEFSDSYFLHAPYPFYHVGKEFAAYLNSMESPKFIVRKILYEPTVRLLLLQKLEDAVKEGIDRFIPLKLPYGPSTQPSGLNYSFVPSDKEILVGNVQFSASAKNGTHHHNLALDSSIDPNSFWEVGGKYPLWLNIEYKKPTKVLGYFVQTGEYTDRMPVAWQLQGSMNGNEWLDLDERHIKGNWQKNEKRNYFVTNPNSYSYYRLYFTAGNTPGILRIYEIGLLLE